MIDYEGLQAHREQTKKDILELLKTEDRVACVRPTGYGKSHLIAQLCNELEGSKLVLEPGNAIIDYMEKFSIETYNTDYATYHSLLNPKIEQLISKFKSYDYIFLDEMHRALAEKWGKQLEAIFKELEKLPNSIKIIGFSATPIRSDNRNVIDEIFKGVQIEPYYLADAILDSFLPNINYHSSIYEITNKQKQTLIQKDTPLAKQILQYDIDEGVSKIFRENLDLDKEHKIICFVDKISNIPEAVSNIKKWFKTDIHIYEVHSRQSDIVNNKILKDFQNNSGLNIVFAVNILNEGVHIPGVDCVIFLRKTASTILYNQQLGRVISEYNEEPIVFDLVNNIENLNHSYSMIFNRRASDLGIKTEQLTTKNGEKLKITTHQTDLIEKLRESTTFYLTEKEQQFILDNYENMSVYKIANELNRSKKAIYNFLFRKNLIAKIDINYLTEEEKQFILDNYKNMTAIEMSNKLARNVVTIRSFLNTHNLKAKNNINYLTEEEKQFILDNYENMTLDEISNELSRSGKTIRNFLDKNSLKAKLNEKYLTSEEQQFILDNYENMTTPEMAIKFNKTTSSIRRFLRIHNLKAKLNDRCLSKQEQQFILDNYQSMTVHKIANKLNRNPEPIRYFLRKNNLKAKRELTKTQQFILDNYENMSVTEMSSKLNKNKMTICNFLKKNNLKAKLNEKYLTQEEQQFILDNYKNMTAIEISNKLDRSKGAIDNFLRKNNLKAKLSDKYLTQEEQQFILDNYQSMSIIAIANRLDRSKGAIGNFLRNNNLKRN